MKKNIASLQELINKSWTRFQKFLQPIQKSFYNFSQKYPKLTQKIQLSFIYFFGIVDLCYSILTNLFALDAFPEILSTMDPFLKWIFLSPILRIWGSPEKVFFLSYLIIELTVIRSVFQFSKLVKYNILLLFSFLMVQGLIMNYWDLFFHREIVGSAAKWSFDQGILIHTDQNLAVIFFLNTFLVFLGIYFYLYITALQEKFATIPGMTWLTDSVAFWLRIETPTMKKRFRKEKPKKETEESDSPNDWDE